MKRTKAGYRLIYFLAKNGALAKYLKALAESSSGYDITYAVWPSLDEAFVWGHTDDGGAYWRRMAVAWGQIMQETKTSEIH